MQSNNAKTLLVIHHSHTDIGYTEYQAKIEQRHIGFIRQAIALVAKNPGFKWQCECFWGVEKFLESARTDEIEKLIELVLKGKIGISGSYLNFNELLDFEVLNSITRRAKKFGDSIVYEIDSAMTADINGFGWGFSQALSNNGIKNLFTCIHTHHGMYPLGKKFIPFWWQTPRGDRILVWSGEHYHYGNELGLMPGANSSYLTKDECDAEMIFSDNWKIAEIRIPRFFRKLETDNYPYDYVPVMVSGLRTDNSPPNAAIMDFIRKWNAKHGSEYYIRMTTLSEFFRLLREEQIEIPTYSGDFPDWWSDGTASAPEYSGLFRHAQRDLAYYNALINNYPDIDPESTREVEYNLALYAEHTFSHADSVSRPWNFRTHSISARKKTFAVNAYDSVQRLLIQAFAELGESPFQPDVPLRYKVINPLSGKVSGTTGFFVGHYEFNELKLDKGAKIIELKSGNEINYQLINAAMGGEFVIHIELEDQEEKEFEIIPVSIKKPETASDIEESIATFENSFVKLEINSGIGISSWFDKVDEIELVDAGFGDPPFTTISEITPVEDHAEICTVRSKMGLNRKLENTQRSIGKLTGVERVESGSIFELVKLKYDIAGISYCLLELKIYRNEPRIDSALRICKDNRWEPENVYLTLPDFPDGGKSELWLSKAGADFRPLIDQIPGTLTDYYSIQDGYAFTGEDYGIAVACPDTNLIQLGELNYGERKLHDPNNKQQNLRRILAWLMTNYWETNFDAGLGGFYEFRYYIKWGKAMNDHRHALRWCRDANLGIKNFRIRKV